MTGLARLDRRSERTTVIGGILLLSAVSAVTGFVLTQYFSIDVLSSLTNTPEDCFLQGSPAIGRHCFSDYGWAIGYGMQSDPWHLSLYVGDTNDYLASGMLLPVFFGLLGRAILAPGVGLAAYLLFLTAAVLTPAVWAARGAKGLERLVVFVVLGAAAIPAWAAVDRGNPVGFLVPAGLILLIGLRRGRWQLVAVMVVLGALVKPQFAVLVVVLFAQRQWRVGMIAAAATLTSNLGAYLLWPKGFPDSVWQSIRNVFGHGSVVAPADQAWNVSFANRLPLLSDIIAAAQRGDGTISSAGFNEGFRSLIGYGLLVVVVVCILVLGRRVEPAMAGVALLPAASLFPSLSWNYYLVFALPIAALIVRDPDGAAGLGIFDGLDRAGDRRRAIGMCVSVATVITIAQIALPGPLVRAPGNPSTWVWTTSVLAPGLWALASLVIIGSYARRPTLGSKVANDP